MIISDATTIIALINIDRFDILKLFIGSIMIPTEVYKEVAKVEYAKKFIDKEAESGFIKVVSKKDDQRFRDFCFILDSGEAAAIALAIEKKKPLIIDEKKGRKFALKKGVKIVGLVGILRYLYIENQLKKEEVIEIIDKLNRSDFRVSDKLMEMILK